MRKTLVILSIIAFGCSKGDSVTEPPVVTEQDIAFSIDIDPGTNIFAAVAGSQNAVINLTSTMPKDGVVIDLLVSSNADNTKVWSNSQSSINKTITLNIDSLKSGVLCTAKFTVTSKTKSTNSLSKSFSIARK